MDIQWSSGESLDCASGMYQSSHLGTPVVDLGARGLSEPKALVKDKVSLATFLVLGGPGRRTFSFLV